MSASRALQLSSRLPASRSLAVRTSSSVTHANRATGFVAPAARSFTSSVVTSETAEEALEEKKKQSLIATLLHGSQRAKDDGLTAQSHSKTVGRGKYIHEIQRHVVRPDKVDEYKSILGNYYPKLAAEKALGARLIGSFEVQIGEMETFYHIWEYDGYSGYDQSIAASLGSKDVKDMTSQLLQCLASRSNWITQEFAFWATSPPQKSAVERPLYELRTYHLKPGMLLEWETNWRRGLEARKRFVQPIAAYFSQIGQLHTVQHIWRYDSLAQRKETRDSAWQVETWNDTVTQTVKLIDKMHAQIMTPLPWSPLH